MTQQSRDFAAFSWVCETCDVGTSLAFDTSAEALDNFNRGHGAMRGLHNGRTAQVRITGWDNLAQIAESVSEQDEPPLITCAQEGCTHTFYFVGGRQFPRLCFDHAELFANIAKIGGRL